MTTTMKERLARAILKRRFYDCEPDMYGNDLERFFAEIDPQHMHEARDEVEAVLDALYEPTEALAIAGAVVGPDTNSGVFSIDDATEVWQAMIDHIRSEDKT